MLQKLFIVILIIIVISIKPLAISNTTGKAIIDADKVFYDKKNNLIIAKGNVGIFRDGLLINADELEFNKLNNVVMVRGNVKITEPNGEVFFGSKAELFREVKESVIYDLRTKIENRIYLGAAKAKYFSSKKILTMRHASLTTCEFCIRSSPQWQFNSSKVEYNQQEEKIYHRNSFFELYGMPVMYTPYFSHFAPNAAPKSGFLLPSYKYKTFYGNGIELKYYYRISHSADLLYKPIITKQQGVLHQVDYHQKFDKGKIYFVGSYNKPKTKNLGKNGLINAKYPTNRYNYRVKYEQPINEYYNFNALIDRSSDKNYLRQYYDINENYLSSNLTLDYFKGRDYASIKNLYFQGLRTTDNPSDTPYILPIIDFHKEFAVNDQNFIFDLNLLNLNRREGLGVNRAIIDGGWSKVLFLSNGLELTNKLNIRGSFYHYRKLEQFQQNNSTPSGIKENRVLTTPTYQANLSYPLISIRSNNVSIIEPILQFVATPNFTRSNKIVNEDSLSIEINDANLFSNDRYSGYDRVEDGVRTNYGLIGSTTITGKEEKYYFYMIGQSYRFKKNPNYAQDSGLKNKFSDVVGHLGFKPIKYFDAFYRYRFDPYKRRLRRSEVDLNFNYYPFGLRSRFIHYNYGSITDPLTVKESISISPTFSFDKQWSVEGGLVRNSSKQKKFLVSSELALVYDGQCSWFKLRASKDFTIDKQRNIKPSVTVLFDFILKGLQ